MHQEHLHRRQLLRRGAGALAAGMLLGSPLARAALPTDFTPPPMKPVQVGEHSWYVQGLSELGSSTNQNFISNAGFVITDDSVVVIDALGSPVLAQRLLAHIAEITPLPVRTVVLTHYHADHVYGLQVLKEAGAHVVAQEDGRAYLYEHTTETRLQASRKEMAPWIDEDTHIVPADEWISERQEHTAGGLHFVLDPVGPAHTAEDLVVYVPEDRVLYSGDVVFANRVPYVGEADSRSWLQALEHLLEFDIRVIVPGHGDASHDPHRDIITTRDYLQFLRDSMRQAAEDLTPFDEAYEQVDWGRFKDLPLFDEANRMNAYNTYLLMETQVE